MAPETLNVRHIVNKGGGGYFRSGLKGELWKGSEVKVKDVTTFFGRLFIVLFSFQFWGIV